MHTVWQSTLTRELQLLPSGEGGHRNPGNPHSRVNCNVAKADFNAKVDLAIHTHA